MASAEQLFSFLNFVERKMEHSTKTWPNQSLLGVLAHVRKECDEIECEPLDSEEWVDLILLGIDGACRSGLTPEGLIWTLQHKLDINLSREWPEPPSPDSPGEHNRSVDGTTSI